MAKAKKKIKIKKLVKKNIRKAKTAKRILVSKKNIKKIVKIRKQSTKVKHKKHSGVLQNARIVKAKKKNVKLAKKFIVRHSIAKKSVSKKANIKHREVKLEKKSFEAEALFRARIKVVGIGGGGGSIVSEIGRSLQKATFVVADTDIRAIKKKSGIKYFLFGQDVTRGLGTGANPDLAKQAALQEKEKIEKLFKDQDIVILIASLGGGLGSGATEVFSKMASSFGAITLGIFTLPFKFEGKNKTRIALKSLKELRSNLNVSITIPNERIFKIIDQNTPITQAFSVVNKNLINSLESLIDLIYNPGMINIDFADLRTILRGKGSLAFLNTVEDGGKNRAEEISKKILINPLYQNNNFVAEKILFNISGPANMSMLEVEKISKGISDINPKAKIIFGISKNSESKNKIKTTILMTGSGEKEELADTQLIVDKTKAENNILTVSQDKKLVKKEKKPSIKLEPIINEDNLETAWNIDKKLSIVQIPDKPAKKAIRRSALDVRKAEEEQENKRLAQEQEWEIPAFLRRVKFKS